VANEKTYVFIEPNALSSIAEYAGKLGSVQRINTASDFHTAGANDTVIVAGRIGNEIIGKLVGKTGETFDTKWLGEQGFCIKTLKGKVLVLGNTHNAVLYGLMELGDRIEDEGGKILRTNLDIKDRPVFLERAGEFRFRANNAGFWATEPHFLSQANTSLFLYDGFPELFPDKNTRRRYRAQVLANRKRLRQRIRHASQYGVRVYLFMYQPTLPGWATEPLFKHHPDTRPKRQPQWWHPFICPSSETSKRILYTKIRNLYRDIPDIGGITLNIGENEQSIVSCGCQKCESQSYRERLKEYLLLILKAMHESNPNAKIFLRPWGIIKHGLGSAENFRSLARELPKEICFITKVTVPPGGDYLWHDYFSPLINMPRMAIFGEHVSHPNMIQPCVAQLCYTAPKLKARLMKLADMGILGRPAVMATNPSEVLYEPSRLATHKLCWDPYTFEPDKFLVKWANKRFGQEAGPLVADALKDTYKITDAFTILKHNTNWFHMLNFVRGKKTHVYSASTVAEQTPDVAGVNKRTLIKVLSKFDIKEAIAIAENAEHKLDMAFKRRPNDVDLRRFWMMAKATSHLARFYKNYHYALVYNNLSEKTQSGNGTHYKTLAAKYIKEALLDKSGYVEWMHKLYPDFGRYFHNLKAKWGKRASIPRKETYILFGQMASVAQQCDNAYHRVVMEPLRAKEYPHILWHLANPHRKIGHKRYGPHTKDMFWSRISPGLIKRWKGEEFVVNLDDPDPLSQSLPAILSPWILPKLRIQFTADLNNGGMLVLRMVPLGPKAGRQMGMRKSILRVRLDGKDVSTLTDYVNNSLMEDNEFIRYVKLPVSSSRQKHEIELISEGDCSGSELYFLRLYTARKQDDYLPNNVKHEPNVFHEKLSPPLWSYEF
jgi:hypothetical protein